MSSGLEPSKILSLRISLRGPELPPELECSLHDADVPQKSSANVLITWIWEFLRSTPKDTRGLSLEGLGVVAVRAYDAVYMVLDSW